MEEENGKHTEIKVYRRRYAIAFMVVLLNISNAAIWISYSPSATTIANYYDNIDVAKINAFSLVFLIVTMPMTFISTYIVNRFGMWDNQCHFSRFYTLYSHESFSIMVSRITASPSNYDSSNVLTNPLGIVIAQATVPVIINEEEDNIPLNNYIWMGLAVICLILTFLCVTRSKPKTPPSLSAGKEKKKVSYFKQLKSAFSSLSYFLLFLALGAGIGVFTAISTATQQLLCPLGYSDEQVLMGVLVDKTKLFCEITKYAFGFGAIALIILFEFFLVPDVKGFIIVFAAIFGFFGVGSYPVGLELAVEVTYPIEESVSTAFIFLSGQLQGLIAVVLVQSLARPQDSSRAYLNVCNGNIIDTAKEYSVPLMIVMGYMAILVIVMIILMKPKYKRLAEDRKEEQKKTQINDHVT
ncbi:Uncharacterized protein Anas_08060 [Armadillidium nasatum]|uniref:Uncharacterized protein n=1 Tax=Armadillidium nasatum TaxID=96803 RepID=A0A5N5T3B8_9CRUS|nr:Uncharacterized protein Anas_08060 [Armadillidium nasatum]